MRELFAPWLAVEVLLFVGGGLALAAFARRRPLGPAAWWPVPLSMAGLGLLVAVMREQLVPTLVQRLPAGQIATTAQRLHVENADAVWLIAMLIFAWCLGAAWTHGVARPDPLRLAVALGLGGIALTSGDGRLGISAVAVAVASLAPGSLGVAAGLLATISGFAGHVGWLARAAMGTEPGMVWLAWATGTAWPLAALIQSAPAFGGRHAAGFGVGWTLGIGVLAAWLSTSGASREGVRPAALGAELRRADVEAPHHVPFHRFRLREQDCVFAWDDGTFRAIAGPPSCPLPEPESRRFVAVDGGLSLRSVASAGPSEWYLVVDVHGAALPGDLERWRWSWEPLRIVADGSRYPVPDRSVRVRFRRGVPTLAGGALLTDSSLAGALADAPLRVTLVAEPDSAVTIDEWLGWCRAARAHHRFVRCAVEAR